MLLSERVYCVVITFKLTERVEQWICIKFCVKFEHSFLETIHMIQKAAAMGNWWSSSSSWQRPCSCILSHAEFFGETSNHSGDSGPLQPRFGDFWLFPKLKSPLKGNRFHTIDEIQENMMGQPMAIERIVWGSKEPTLKGTEASLSYVQCFLCLLQ